MNDPILHYLIIFDHANDHREVIEFGEDIEAALDSYTAKEDEFADHQSVEVVLLGSDSLESVRATHSNYFPERMPTANWLVKLGLSREVSPA